MSSSSSIDLCTVASIGDVALLRKVLDSCTADDVRAASPPDDDTPLHCAARHGHFAACRLLLRRGADAGALLIDGTTPALDAAKGGHSDVVWLLMGLVNAPMLLASSSAREDDRLEDLRSGSTRMAMHHRDDGASKASTTKPSLVVDSSASALTISLPSSLPSSPLSSGGTPRAPESPKPAPPPQPPPTTKLSKKRTHDKKGSPRPPRSSQKPEPPSVAPGAPPGPPPPLSSTKLRSTEPSPPRALPKSSEEATVLAQPQTLPKTKPSPPPRAPAKAPPGPPPPPPLRSPASPPCVDGEVEEETFSFSPAGLSSHQHRWLVGSDDAVTPTGPGEDGEGQGGGSTVELSPRPPPTLVELKRREDLSICVEGLGPLGVELGSLLVDGRVVVEIRALAANSQLLSLGARPNDWIVALNESPIEVSP